MVSFFFLVLELCKADVKDFKVQFLSTNPYDQMGLKDPNEFDFKLINLGLNSKIPSVNQTYINTTIQ